MIVCPTQGWRASPKHRGGKKENGEISGRLVGFNTEPNERIKGDDRTPSQSCPHLRIHRNEGQRAKRALWVREAGLERMR